MIELNFIKLIVSLLIIKLSLGQISFDDFVNKYGDDPSLLAAYHENPTMAEARAIIGPFRREEDEAGTCGQLIASRGFKYTIHYVVTSDGYILKVYRIINPYAVESGIKQKPFLLIHGLVESCVNWLYALPDGHIKEWINGQPPNDTSSALAFFLANIGVDVWIMNCRGTTYSTNHTTLDPKTDPEFWDFSFHEMAIFDLPAVVDYIRMVTKNKQMTVVGHSRGALMLLIKLSLDPEYEVNFDKIYLVAAPAYLGETRGLPGLFPHLEILGDAVGAIRAAFPPALAYINAAGGLFCQIPINEPACLTFFDSILGYDPNQINKSRLAVYFSGIDQTSFKDFGHFIQSLVKNHVSFYDYGKIENLERYNSINPPIYPYHKIRTTGNKITLVSSYEDYFVTQKDNDQLRNDFRNISFRDFIISKNETWNHETYLYAIQNYQYFEKIFV